MCRTRNPFLGVTKRVGEIDQSVTQIEVGNSVSAGIRWRRLGEGMVPIFEEHSARLERGFSISDWYAMDRIERAMVIALRRIENASRSLQSEAEAKHAKKNARKR